MPRLSLAPLRALRAPRAAPALTTRAFHLSSRRFEAAVPPSAAPPLVGSSATANATDAFTGEVIKAGDIDPSRLEIELTSNPKPIPETSKLVFGRQFTDHMLTIPWNAITGWGAPKIQPYGPLSLDPSSTVLHYAPTLFEGLKAYKGKDGVPRLFRPDKNMERMVRSAARLAFPTFTGEHLTTLLKKLVEIDSKWVPTDPGTSLYIRPTMIGTQAGLGVGASTDVLLFIIMSPVGPYYSTGFKPVKLYATTTDVRAWPGGTGGYKLGSNYAAGVVPQQKAAALGYQQILWLFGDEHQLTEVGTMNLWLSFRRDDGVLEVVTPPLGDMILPGVTRDSVLNLLKDHASEKNRLEGLPEKLIVTERQVTMPEVRDASRNGTLREIFGTGTAAIVSPVDGIGYEDELVKVPVGEDGLGDVARVILREIVGRQTGEIPSEWSQTVV